MPPDFTQQLRTANLRVTKPRTAVLEAVHTHPHGDTESIIKASRGLVPDISHQAVYDVLRVLTGVGLIRRIQPHGHVVRYESRVGDNHHHVICRECGVIGDVDCAIGESPCLTASNDHGFHIDEAEIMYWGLCPSCISSQSNQSENQLERDHCV